MNKKVIIPDYLNTFIKKDAAHELAQQNESKNINSELSWPGYQQWFNELSTAIENAAKQGKRSVMSPSLSIKDSDGWLVLSIKPKLVVPILKEMGYTVVKKLSDNALKISF